MPNSLAGAYPFEESALQLAGLGGPEANPESTYWLSGLTLRVPSSQMDRPARGRFANVVLKGPSD